ncbi:MAG: hypothetical protein ACREJC_21625, partial [Tepidisphaeraceae bacterium]
DYWKGDYILFTSGTIAGQCRLITSFTAASDTITFAPATTQAVSTQTYEILPSGAADVRLWNGTAPNNLIAGRVDANAQALAASVVDDIWAKTMTELSAVPAISASVLAALSWVFELARNRITQTASVQTVFKDDATTTLATSAVSDNGTTYERPEFV